MKTESSAAKRENGATAAAANGDTAVLSQPSQSQTKGAKVKKEFSLPGQTRDPPDEVGEQGHSR